MGMAGFLPGPARPVGLGPGGRGRKEAPPGCMRTLIRREYPMIDLGADRQGAQAITAALGIETPYPSNCRSCPSASAHDVLRLHRVEPDAFETWAGFEARKLAHPKWVGTRNHTVMGNDLTLWQNLERAERQHGHLSTAELNEVRFCRGHQNMASF